MKSIYSSLAHVKFIRSMNIIMKLFDGEETGSERLSSLFHGADCPSTTPGIDFASSGLLSDIFRAALANGAR